MFYFVMLFIVDMSRLEVWVSGGQGLYNIIYSYLPRTSQCLVCVHTYMFIELNE